MLEGTGEDIKKVTDNLVVSQKLKLVQNSLDKITKELKYLKKKYKVKS